MPSCSTPGTRIPSKCGTRSATRRRGYGLAIGGTFVTKSQFSREPNTSKIGFAVLNWHLARWGFAFNDGKVMTPTCRDIRLSAEVPRREFLARLADADRSPVENGHWQAAADVHDDCRMAAAISGSVLPFSKPDRAAARARSSARCAIGAAPALPPLPLPDRGSRPAAPGVRDRLAARPAPRPRRQAVTPAPRRPQPAAQPETARQRPAPHRRRQGRFALSRPLRLDGRRRNRRLGGGSRRPFWAMRQQGLADRVDPLRVGHGRIAGRGRRGNGRRGCRRQFGNRGRMRSRFCAPLPSALLRHGARRAPPPYRPRARS